jgi:hypothetical protein
MAIAALARSAPGSAGGILLAFTINMNDDLPEIFDQIKPPAAPSHLRSRVLAAVNGELAKRRKPRWERVLELSVAASFVLGVGLNLSEFLSLWQERYRIASKHDLAASQTSENESQDATWVQGSLHRQYANLLTELLREPAG